MGGYDYISGNIENVRNEIRSACKEFGRSPDDITLVAVSKTFPVEAITSANKSGQLDFGENKVQELAAKHGSFAKEDIRWHLVGKLQTNKVKYVVPFVHLIHSVDSLKLAEEIQSRAFKEERIIDCLIQVNTSDEEQKAGCEVNEALNLSKQISIFENVKVRGLMTMAKYIDDYNDSEHIKIVRANFRTLKMLFDELKSFNEGIKFLSMGMTQDLKIAVEEGSNMLRVGTAIFGKRKREE